MTNQASLNNNVVLTNLFRGYEPKEYQFVQDELLPTIPVNNDIGDIRSVETTADDFLRVHTDVRVGSAGTPEISFRLTKSTIWQTEEHALKIRVTKKDGLRWAAPGQDWMSGMDQAKQVYTRFLKKTFRIAREYALATALTTAGTYTNKVTLSGADQFNDRVNSDPIGVIQTGKNYIFNAIGVEANTMTMSRAVFVALQMHPQIKATVGAVNGTGTVPVLPLSKEQMAMVFGVDKIIVASASYQSVKRGQTSSLAQCWGKFILLAYINPNPTPNELERSLGYKFQLEAPSVDSWSDNDPKNVDFVRVQEDYDDVIVDQLAGYLISAAVA